MKVFPVMYSGADEDAFGCQGVYTTQARAIERAELLAQGQLDDEPELSQDGWYMNTIETDYGVIVVIADPKDNVSDVWTITEEDLEE